MNDLSAYSDLIEGSRDFKYVGSAPAERLTEALVAKQLNFMWACAASECEIRPLLNKVCEQMGTTVGNIQNRDIKFFAQIEAFESKDGKKYLPSTRFIQSTRDYLLSQCKFVETLECAQTAARHTRYQGRMSIGFLVTTAVCGVLARGMLTTFSWWQNTLLGLATIAGAVTVPKMAANKEEVILSQLERSADPFIINQWAQVAMKQGWKIAVADRWYDPNHPNSAGITRTLSKIDNICEVSPEKIRYFIDKATLNLPDIQRGFQIEVYPDDRELFGTHLILRAYPTKTNSANTGGNNRRRKKRNYKAEWGWIPKPALA